MINFNRFFLFTPLVFIPSISFATGLNFWESSAINSALASANGASAIDASILATAPSSMVYLNRPRLTANVTHYQVDTDYDILSMQAHYSQSEPIPAGFFTTALNDNWFFGMTAFSRTAADISIPQLTIFFPETRVRPIVISFAPSIAYKMGNISFALTAEYQYGQYLLEKNRCNLFGNCELEKTENNANGWSGAISASWKVNSALALAATHRFATSYKDENILFDLPAITSLYASFFLIDSLTVHTSFSYSQWKDKRIKYTDYADIIGLLRGNQDSKRFAASLEYRLNDLTLMAGISMDEAIDSFGGEDFRYRLGLGYQINDNLRLDLAGFKEDYSRKYLESSIGNVDVQNSGYGVSLGISYSF